MTKETLRALTVLFSLSLAGIVFSLGMTIYTAVDQARQKSQPSATPFPVPAY